MTFQNLTCLFCKQIKPNMTILIKLVSVRNNTIKVSYLTTYKMHGRIRRTPNSAGQIKKSFSETKYLN